MISLLKRLFSSQTKIASNEDTKVFQFLIADRFEQIEKNKWYRRNHWETNSFLRMETEWSRDWKTYSTEEPVVGVTQDDRQRNFFTLTDQSDFKIYLEREPNNEYDKNAIKVMGVATVDGTETIKHLGYLSRETAEDLKDEDDLDARPYSVYLPVEDKAYGLRVRVLIRSESYKKKQKTANKTVQ